MPLATAAAAVAATGHFPARTPWLEQADSAGERDRADGDMTLATTVSLAVLPGAVPLAKTLAALDVLSDGRLIADLGPAFVKLRLRRPRRLVRRALEAVRRGRLQRCERCSTESLLQEGALLPHALGSRTRAGSPTRARHTSLDRQLGLERRTAQGGRAPETAGSPLPTTRRRTASPKLVAAWHASSKTAAAARRGFPMLSPRCGPGSPEIAPRATESLATSWPRS